MSNGTRLLNELDLWRTAWNQVETFLDRIDEQRDKDAPYAELVAAWLDVATVVEHHKARTGDDDWLDDPIRPGPSPSAAITTDAMALRVPGVDDIEAALAPLEGDADSLKNNVILRPNPTLFELRTDEGAQAVHAPDYDFGTIGSILRPDADGLFPKAQREAAAESGYAKLAGSANEPSPLAGQPDYGEMTTWSTLRDNRRALVADAREPAIEIVPSPDPSNWTQVERAVHYETVRTLVQTWTANRNQLSDLDSVSIDGDTISAQAFFSQFAGIAAPTATDLEADATRLEAAVAVFNDQELDAGIINAVDGARRRLAGRATAWRTLDQWLQPSTTQAMADAIGAGWNTVAQPLGATTQSDAVITAAVHDDTVDDAVFVRLAYPDGPLRLQRVMEGGLLQLWSFRHAWFVVRRRRALEPLYERFLRPFTASLTALATGTTTPFALPGVTVESPVAALGRNIPIAGATVADLAQVRTGTAAIVEGERPALVLVLGRDQGPTGTPRLLIPKLGVSLSTEEGAEGTPGLLVGGEPITDGPFAVTNQALRLGRDPARPTADAVLQQIAALRAHLALLLGARVTAVPSAFSDSFSLNGTDPDRPNEPIEPVRPGASRLLVPLSSIPTRAAYWDRSLVPAIPVLARPGERLLIRGADADDKWWQGVVEVDSLIRVDADVLDVQTEPAAGFCCGSKEPLLLIQLRGMWLDATLTRNVTLRRDFQGFDVASLAAGVLLPIEVDDGTARLHVTEGGIRRDIDRYGEFDAAVKVLGEWLRRPS